MFPQELTTYPQWICWRLELTSDGKPTKLPYCPHTGRLASVADPRTWTDYQTAVNVALKHPEFYSGIGFVLSDNDPFCFIDLDDPGDNATLLDRQRKICAAMDSYSELSPSGRGLHIIIKAKLPNGTRREKVEIYSSQRYMTMTGNTYEDKPVAERQYLAQMLWTELTDNGNGNHTEVKVQDQPEQYADADIYASASNAENGSKFIDLWQGNWTHYYSSQSEADFALINILGFYSRNIQQINRMFLLSALGAREKARKRPQYILKMIKRSFDNAAPLIPLEAVIEAARKQLEEKTTAGVVRNPFAGPLFADIPDPAYEWTTPPGLLGEIADFIYAAAPRPVKEVALGAAIALMAGICGRSYNVSKTGLNQYILILAKTGIGKEAAALGIDRLTEAVKKIVPAAADFIGPSDIASGQALRNYLGKNPCFLSIVGEFGLLLQQICSPVANQSQQQLRRALLALYNKSGAEDTLRKSIYSDQEKTLGEVKSPSFTLLGESTPETFYINLDDAMISQGLMPRFLCIEYLGDRPALNPGHSAMQPDGALVQKIGELTANCLTLAHHNKVIDVTLDAEAQTASDAFDKRCDGYINTSEIEVARQLWNRAHLKALKLSALIAIGLNPYQPIVDLQCIQWAMDLVERDIRNILKQFETGRAGRESGELNQINDLRHIIKDYINRPYTGLEKYRVVQQLHADRVIGWDYLQRRTLSRGCFKNDRMGATSALKRAMDALVAEGSMAEVKPMQMYTRYGRTMKAFAVVDPSKF